MTPLMPAIFFGHGNPLNALAQNSYTEGWTSIGRSIPRPKAVLSVSAHWYLSYCAVTSNPAPPTIHDFGGFPRELYQVQYPAPGNPDLARQVQGLLAPVSARLDDGWGLDHGTWAVLRHVFPEAHIPVLQLGIDGTQPPRFHYDLGRKLAPLREEGVLVVGSGNLVHNLTAYAWGDREARPFDWAVRFEERLQEALLQNDDETLVDYRRFGRDAALAVPTPDHYLPLLYVLGLRREQEPVTFPIRGVDGGSVSMLAVRVG
jgi:4,5-DOPA dioxygenase extradiol